MLSFVYFILFGGIGALQWSNEEATIPSFITKHAPVVYLYSEERYFPGSIEDYVTHFVMSTGSHNYTNVSINNLTAAAAYAREQEADETADVFLTSLEQWEPEPGPEWLTCYKSNRPNLWTGKIDNAMATLIVVDKPEQGVIDAFWHYFYPFNLGPFVMGHGPFGNHLGDWEHSLVRFDKNTSKPIAVWMSAHGGGTAYTWESLLEEDIWDATRPVIFSARGTHAQYTSVGRHSHDIPWHMLADYTDKGDIWDPARNYAAYVFDGETVRPANGSEPEREQRLGDWLLYDGHWGNKQLPGWDVRQNWSPFEWRLIDGPTGPLFKNLMREAPCERFKWWNLAHSCRIRQRITAGEGMEANASGCEAVIERVPEVFQPIFRVLTFNGWICFWIDRLFS